MIDCHVHYGQWDKSNLLGVASNIDSINATFREFDEIYVMPSDGKSNVITALALVRLKVDHKFIAWYRGSIKDIFLSGPSAIKFHPVYMHAKVTEACYTPAIQYAYEKNLPIFIHTGTLPISWHTHALQLARIYPEINFVLCHLGGERADVQLDLVREAKNMENVFLDLTGRHEFSIAKAFKAGNPHSFVWGSDYPIGHPSTGLGTLQGFLKEGAHEILDENPKRIWQ